VAPNEQNEDGADDTGGTGDTDDDDTDDGVDDDTPEGVATNDSGVDNNTPTGVGPAVAPATEMDKKYGSRQRGNLRARKADVFTKPLQGAAFVKFRKLILNLNDCGPAVKAPVDHRSVLDKEVTWTDVVRIGPK
jgi:hypothetical protein